MMQPRHLGRSIMLMILDSLVPLRGAAALAFAFVAYKIVQTGKRWLRSSPVSII